MTNLSNIFIITAMVITLAVTSLGEDAPAGPHLPKTKIRRAWYRGFMGYIHLPIEEDVERGWRMILDFRRRIKYLEVCGAIVDNVTEDKRRYYLSNESWDGVLSEGDVLRLFFTADTFPKVRGQIATIQFLPIALPSGPTEVAPSGPTEIAPSGSTKVAPSGPTEATPIESSWSTKRTTGGSPGAVNPGGDRTATYSSGTVTVANLTSNVTVSSYGTSPPSTASTLTPSTLGATTKSTTESGDVCVQTCGSSTNINSEWSGNFGGELTIPVTNIPTNGWTATIWFQNRVTSLQIWNAIVVSSYTTDGGDTVYTIRNQSWNSDLTWSGPLYLTFTASIPTSQSGQTFYAHLNGQPECACGA